MQRYAADFRCKKQTWDTIKGGNEGQDNVTGNLLNPLPTSGNNSTTIAWSAVPGGWIDTPTGAVTRPTYTQGDQTVTLSATVSKAGGTPQTKVYNLTVKAVGMTADEAINQALAELTWDTIRNENTDQDNITGNLVNPLPTLGNYDTTIAWGANPADWIDTATGAVTIPTYIQGDKFVTLYAEVMKDGQYHTKVFNLTIKKAGMTADDIINLDYEALTWDVIKALNSAENNVTANLVNPLPAAGPNGSTITWSASPVDQGWIDTTSGEITRPTLVQGDKTVTLTATINRSGGTDRMKDFTVTVKASEVNWQGEGTQSNPFQVATAEHLNNVRNYPNNSNVYFIQTADIDLDAAGYTNWIPIGDYSTNSFSGSYNGNGFTISNLNINDSTLLHVGLFGYADSGAKLDSIKLVNVNIQSNRFGADVGGLVGLNNGGTVNNCYSAGSVTGDVLTQMRIGGLVGYNRGIVRNGSSDGTVTGRDEAYVGGLTGRNEGTIEGSYSTCDIIARDNSDIGGIVGLNTGSISDSYSTGSVSGSTSARIGGLVGKNQATIISSFYNWQTTGQSDTGKGEPKTTADMKQEATFTAAGWDFTSTWRIINGETYPYLSWQITDTDKAPPIFTDGYPQITGEPTYNAFTLAASADETSTAHYVVLADGAPIPAAAEVKDGTGMDGALAVQSGSIALATAGVPATADVTGLAPGTSYDIYLALEDSAGNLQVQVSDKVEVSTAALTLESIAVTTPPDKTSYYVGESLDLTGLVVTGTYIDSSTAQLTITMDNISGFNSNTTVTGQVVTVTYEGQTATFTVDIIETTLNSIEISNPPTKTIYYVEEELDLTGLVVIGTYSDSSTVPLNITAANISGFDSSAAVSSQVVTVAYEGKIATFTVDIVAAPARVAAPAATPAGGTVADGTTVTLATTTGGATIHYTTDGTDPDTGSLSGTTVIISGIAGSTVTLKVFAVKASMTDSDIVTFTYTIETPPVVSAAISPTLYSFDLDSPADMTTSITWNSAQSVTDVVYGSGHLSEGIDYTIDISNLTIKEAYLSGLYLEEGDSVDFEIFFDAGDSAVLTVQAVRSYIPGNDASLSDLRVNNMTITGFVYNNYNYSIQLPYNTQPGTAAATVSATSNDTKASVSVTQASVLPGSATVEVTAEDGTTSQTYTVHFTLEAPVTLESIAVTTPPDKTTYYVGEVLDLTGLIVTGTYSNGSTAPLSITVANISGFDSSAAVSGQIVTVTYEGKTATFTVNIVAAPVTYTVTYNANGGTGTAPTEGNKAAGATFTAATNSFTAPSGKQFKEWNTSASGTGTGYAAGATVTMPANNLTLYAIWENIPIVSSDNANLSGLALSAGTLSPAFNQKVTSYSASVGSGVSSINVTPTLADSKAAVTINGTSVASGSARTVSLNTGDNTITLVVTAENGTTTKTYTITVNRASSSGSGNDNGSRGGGDGRTPVQTPAPTPAVDSNGNITAAPKLDKNTGVAATEIDTATLNTALEKAAENSDGKKTVEIAIPAVEGAKAYEPTLPASALSSSDAGTQLEIKTGIAAVTLPSSMLEQEAATGAKNVSLSIAQADVSGIDNEETRNRIGDRPVIQLNLKVDGKPYAWSNENAPVTVSIPYKPTTQELADPEHITVWYIDGKGNVVEVPSGRYDPATGMVTFSTTHFSNYAVAYVTKTFNDLGSAAWAKKPIEVLASKGILKGTSETEYAPGTNITRADFLYFLVRTLGVDAKIDGNFDDISSDAYYYKEIAIAKKLGITSGTGNNKFSPDASITRQDMMVLTERALRMMKKLEAQGTASDLDKFADKSLVAAYAVNGVASVVKEGLIVGSGGNVNPLGNTTRAEAAVFLYRIYNK